MDKRIDLMVVGLMDVEMVQKALGRSRASVYRYANTDAFDLNPPYDPRRLNPELRQHKDEPMLFHPSEVARFSRDVLKNKDVIIQVQPTPQTPIQQALEAILSELQQIHQLLKMNGIHDK